MCSWPPQRFSFLCVIDISVRNHSRWLVRTPLIFLHLQLVKFWNFSPKSNGFKTSVEVFFTGCFRGSFLGVAQKYVWFLASHITKHEACAFLKRNLGLLVICWWYGAKCIPSAYTSAMHFVRPKRSNIGPRGPSFTRIKMLFMDRCSKMVIVCLVQ